MLTFEVKTNIQDTIKKLEEMQRGLGDKAARSAVNKCADQAKTQMSRLIREDYNISAALLRERLVVRKSFRSDGMRISAALIGNPNAGGKGRSMNVIHFLERSVSMAEAKRRRRGGTLDQLHFKIKRQGGKVRIPGAFIANAGRTVFQREGKGRLPIKPVQTIGIPQMFNTKKNRTAIVAWINANLPRIMDHEVQHYLRTFR